MKEIILIKNGELALKGLNRSTFEDILIKNIRKRLKSLGEFEYTKAQSTISVIPLDESIDMDEAASRVGHVFGIAGYSRALQVEKDISCNAANIIVSTNGGTADGTVLNLSNRRSDDAANVKCTCNSTAERAVADVRIIRIS